MSYLIRRPLRWLPLLALAAGALAAATAFAQESDQISTAVAM